MKNRMVFQTLFAVSLLLALFTPVWIFAEELAEKQMKEGDSFSLPPAELLIVANTKPVKNKNGETFNFGDVCFTGDVNTVTIISIDEKLGALIKYSSEGKQNKQWKEYPERTLSFERLSILQATRKSYKEKPKIEAEQRKFMRDRGF